MGSVVHGTSLMVVRSDIVTDAHYYKVAVID